MRCGQAELSHEETHADTSGTSWATAGVNIVKNLVLGSSTPTALLLKHFPFPGKQLINIFWFRIKLQFRVSCGSPPDVLQTY